MAVGKEQIYQVATNMIAASEALALFIPERTTYQVKGPKFPETPKLFVNGYDITPALSRMAGATSEFQVDHVYIPHDWDGDMEVLPFHTWDISRPGEVVCRMGNLPGNHPNQSSQGLGTLIFCPELDTEPTNSQISKFRRKNHLSVELLNWRASEEQDFDPMISENILLRMITKRHKTTALKIGEWILQSIRQADEYNLIEIHSY